MVLDTVSILLMATSRGRLSRRKWGSSTVSLRSGARGLRQPDHHVGLSQGSEGRLRQAGVEGPLGLQDPRGVQEEHLGRGLLTMPNNRKRVVWGLGVVMAIFPPTRLVQKGGFAHVGIADQGDKAAFERVFGFRLSAFGGH